jgi:osmotically-inducible protein OsmY
MTIPKRSDAQIDLDVLHELAWDTRLESTGIDAIESVVVTGTVPSHGEHDAIVGVITGTPGVCAVDDRLAVHARLPRRAVLGP